MGQSTVDRVSKPMSPLKTRALEIAADTTDGLAEFVAAVPYPSGPVPVDGKGAADWIIVDAALNPHLAAGTLSMPHHARCRLERIAATGVRFDTLLIGDELARNTLSQLGVKERERPGTAGSPRPTPPPSSNSRSADSSAPLQPTGQPRRGSRSARR